MSTTTARPPLTPLVASGEADCHVRDMTATFAADLTLAGAQDALVPHEQWLPIDGDPSRPLGELIAGNSTGPLRLGYGAWRDLLLGVQFRTRQRGTRPGELITAGGRTVKNVAGYDLTKLMVGQRGQLGEIMTLTVRTYRRPAGAIAASFAPDLSIVRDLMPTPLRPQWMLLDGDSLVCGYLGDAATLAYYRRKLAEISPRSVIERSLEADIADRAALFVGAVRVSVPPAKAQAFVAKAQAFAATAGLERWIADPAFGIFRCDGDVQAIRAAAASVGGSVVDPPGLITDPLLLRLAAAFGEPM